MAFLGFENYRRGFLQDDEIIAGITNDGDEFVAFVIALESGALISSQRFSALNDALRSVNQLPRELHFTDYSSSGCNGGVCGEGTCDPMACAASCTTC